MTLPRSESTRQITPDDAAALPAWLHQLGYQHQESSSESVSYYAPDADTTSSDAFWHVRTAHERSAITYPRFPPDHGSWPDSREDRDEVSVYDPYAAQRMLTRLGLVYRATVTCHRQHWRHRGNTDVSVSLDTLDNIGTFVTCAVVADETIGAEELLKLLEQQLELTGMPRLQRAYRDLALSAAGSTVSAPTMQ